MKLTTLRQKMMMMVMVVKKMMINPLTLQLTLLVLQMQQVNLDKVEPLRYHPLSSRSLTSILKTNPIPVVDVFLNRILQP